MNALKKKYSYYMEIAYILALKLLEITLNIFFYFEEQLIRIKSMTFIFQKAILIICRISLRKLIFFLGLKNFSRNNYLNNLYFGGCSRYTPPINFFLWYQLRTKESNNSQYNYCYKNSYLIDNKLKFISNTNQVCRLCFLI